MKTYESLAKKYDLPPLEDLKETFSLYDLEDHLLQRIRKKMSEKFEDYSKMVESVLQPENTLSSLYETHYFNSEKDDAYPLFKRLMFIVRYSDYVSLENTEEKNAQYIKVAWDLWNEVKEDMKEFLEKLKGVWEKETDIAKDKSYFG